MIVPLEPQQHECRASDGTRLVGDLWSPDEPVGTVLIRTPYDARAHASTGRSWAARGYRCLVQDVRGRYRSDGGWQPYQHEGDDGAATVTSLRRTHPALPVVVFGASYAAHTALEAARAVVASGDDGPAGAVLLVPALGLAETARDTCGRPQERSRIGWWHEHGRTRRSEPPLSTAELGRRTEAAARIGPVPASRDWGWTTEALEQWERLWSADRVDLASRYSTLRFPALVVTGDHDVFDHDARRLVDAWRGPAHLVTGPWGHRLAADVTDEQAAASLRSAGGVGAVIDAWLATHLPTADRPVPGQVSAGTPRTTSRFDPLDGSWHHERTSA